MGLRSKTKSKQKRAAQRKALKEQRKALYQSYARLGRSKGSRRMTRRAQMAKKQKLRAVSHPDGDCGNAGCAHCVGINFHPFLMDGNMPQKLWLKFNSLSPEDKLQAAKGVRIKF